MEEDSSLKAALNGNQSNIRAPLYQVGTLRSQCLYLILALLLIVEGSRFKKVRFGSSSLEREVTGANPSVIWDHTTMLVWQLSAHP